MTDTLINGLKSNVKRGFGIADMWRENYVEAVDMLVKSWKHIHDKSIVEPMAWKVVETYPFYVIHSERSVIKHMVIPAKTYTTKKGITKTKPEEKVPAHYTQSGKFIGRVSNLGSEAIKYHVKSRISRENCDFLDADGDRVVDYFAHKDTE